MEHETLEEKVERLEFYIDLLREFATDPEMFAIWDWAIGERLTQQQVKSIMKTISAYHTKFNREPSQSVADLFDAFSKEINRILSSDPQDRDNHVVFQLLKRVNKMGIAEELIHEFLKLEST